MLVAAFAVRQPFCRICPMLSFNAVFQRLSPMRLVKKQHDKCDKCGICAKACPMDIHEIAREHGSKAYHEDCTLCGRCVEFCPDDGVIQMKWGPLTLFGSSREYYKQRMKGEMPDGTIKIVAGRAGLLREPKSMLDTIMPGAVPLPETISLFSVWLLGVSMGLTACTVTCLPFMGTWVLGRGGSNREALLDTGVFMLGRVTAYSLLGGLAGALGVWLTQALSSGVGNAFIGASEPCRRVWLLLPARRKTPCGAAAPGRRVRRRSCSAFP